MSEGGFQLFRRVSGGACPTGSFVLAFAQILPAVQLSAGKLRARLTRRCLCSSTLQHGAPQDFEDDRCMREVVRIMFAVMPSPTRLSRWNPLSGWRMHNASLQSRLSGGCLRRWRSLCGRCLHRPALFNRLPQWCMCGRLYLCGGCVRSWSLLG